MSKTERFEMRIDTELKRKLQQKSKEENRTLSNYIEMILKNAIIEKENPNENRDRNQEQNK